LHRFNAASVAVMVRIVDRQALLALYDRQLRRDVRVPDVEEATLERHAKTVVWYGTADDDLSGVIWSDLTDEDAEAVIAAEVGRLRERGARSSGSTSRTTSPPTFPAVSRRRDCGPSPRKP
jgi:hypothetical protein